MRPRKVLYVHTTSEVGGSDVSLAHIVERLDASRYRAVVALPADGPLVPRLERAGATVTIVPAMRKLTSRQGRAGLAAFAAGYPRGVLALASRIRSHGIDLVHTNTIHNLYGWAAARLTRRPHIWHVREIVWQSGALRRLEVALALGHSARVVVTSEAVGRMFERGGAMPARVVRIANGVDVARFTPDAAGRVRHDFGIPPAAPLVGAAGRLDTWKGFEDFIAAAAHVHRERPDARFVIAGGPIEGHARYQAQLERQASESGLDGVLFFAGWRYGPEEMPGFYRSLDLFVLPSREPEPFGLVVLEAMASARPVVATAHGGPLEIVVDGVTGLLTPPRDPLAMSRSIGRLIGDPGAAARMGEAGRQRAVDGYSIERTVTSLQSLYDEVIAG